jgi:hypothetical protein
MAYGGTLTEQGGQTSVVPRDGLRQRFCAMLSGGSPVRTLRLELDRDGFAADAPIVFDRALGRVSATLENRTADRHRTVLRLEVPPGASYELRVEGRRVSRRGRCRARAR